LDNYTADLEGAYALALLDSTYTGDCIRVRRASDNTEQDIGFDGQDLDTNALTTFCTGTDCFVKTWYDQSGNTLNATQTTTANQPKIYDSSTGVIVDNLLPAMSFDGSNDYFTTATISTIAQPTTKIAVSKFNATSAPYIMDGKSQRQVLGLSSAAKYRLFSGTVLDSANSATTNAQYLMFGLFNSTSSSMHVNGVSQSSGNAGTQGFDGLTIGASQNPALSLFNGYLQMAVVYSADKSSDRAAIEANINDYYSIY